MTDSKRVTREDPRHTGHIMGGYQAEACPGCDRERRIFRDKPLSRRWPNAKGQGDWYVNEDDAVAALHDARPVPPASVDGSVWRQCVCGAWYWGAAQTDGDKAHSRYLRAEPPASADVDAAADDSGPRRPYGPYDGMGLSDGRAESGLDVERLFRVLWETDAYHQFANSQVEPKARFRAWADRIAAEYARLTEADR